MKKFLILLILVACATPQKVGQEIPEPEIPAETAPGTVATVTPVPTAHVPATTSKKWKTPVLALPSKNPVFVQAALLFGLHANTDEFYDYVRTKVKKLAGGNETNVEVAIKKYRECLDTTPKIQIVFGSYVPWSDAIGGWNGYVVKQNARQVLYFTPVELAGHWVHEISHACEFTHIANDITKYPIIRDSWPYQVGYKFEDYITEKKLQTPKVAGEVQ